jgi:hypothetical protein
MAHIRLQFLRVIPNRRKVRSRHLSAYRIEEQEEDENVFLLKLDSADVDWPDN